MTSPTVGAERLTKLADALEAAVKAKQYQLSMGQWVGSDSDDAYEETSCGTAGCAIGFCPKVFPEHFRYIEGATGRFGVRFLSDPGGSLFRSAAAFFGIELDAAYELFDMASYRLRFARAVDKREIEDQVVERLRNTAKTLLPPA